MNIRHALAFVLSANAIGCVVEKDTAIYADGEYDSSQEDYMSGLEEEDDTRDHTNNDDRADDDDDDAYGDDVEADTGFEDADTGFEDTDGVVPEAPIDGDHIGAPAAYEFLVGPEALVHSGAISYPGGDLEDWISFEAPNGSNPSQRMWMTIDCTIIGDDMTLRAAVYEDGDTSFSSESVDCGEGEQSITIDNTKVQSVKLYLTGVYGTTYADYQITVSGS